VEILLQGSDVEDDALSYHIASGPSHGSVEITGNIAVYTPNLDFYGQDMFQFLVRDTGGLESEACTVQITVHRVNRPPIPVIRVSPLADLGPSVPGPVVISPNNTNAWVILDGSETTDPDNDLTDLTFLWLVNGEAVAEGVVVEVALEVGLNAITLQVDDGLDSGEEDLAVEVITAAQATEELVLQVYEAMIARKTKQPFLATLKAAMASFDRNSMVSGDNQLNAFQNKTSAQVGRDYPDLAEEWIRIAQVIRDAIAPEEP
jgi:hypothetical protein